MEEPQPFNQQPVSHVPCLYSEHPWLLKKIHAQQSNIFRICSEYFQHMFFIMECENK